MKPESLLLFAVIVLLGALLATHDGALPRLAGAIETPAHADSGPGHDPAASARAARALGAGGDRVAGG